MLSFQKKILLPVLDARTAAIGKILSENGFSVIDSLSSAKDLARFPAILLPLPSFPKGRIRLSCGEELGKFEFLSLLSEGTLLLGGILPPELNNASEKYGILLYDYYREEALIEANAGLTAEGTLAFLANHFPLSLSDLRVAVIGCGRIGKELLRLFSLFGSDSTAFARRESALLAVKDTAKMRILIGEDKEGLQKILDASLSGLPYHAVINTVPSVLFTEDLLLPYKSLPKEDIPLFVELASSPGGFDCDALCEWNLPRKALPALPASYAPISSGRILANTILPHLNSFFSERTTL